MRRLLAALGIAALLTVDVAQGVTGTQREFDDIISAKSDLLTLANTPTASTAEISAAGEDAIGSLYVLFYAVDPACHPVIASELVFISGAINALVHRDAHPVVNFHAWTIINGLAQHEALVEARLACIAASGPTRTPTPIIA
jgi:hypothetical protein